MKKKLFSLMMMLLLAATGYVRADELTVHDGSGSSGYVPVWGLWTDNNLQCEFVYPASELSSLNGGDITGLKFYSTSTYTNVSWNGTYQVFVKEVDATTISSFTGTTGATVVYNGSLNVSSSIMEVTFNTPYHYNGGNLLVGVYYSYSGSYANCYWTGETVNGASIYGRSGQSFSATQANFLPKTTFNYTPGSVDPVNPTPGPTIDNGPIHVAYTDANDGEIVDQLNLGTRPAGAWMAPFQFRMFSDGPTYKVTDIDFTPADGLFTIGGEEMPFQINGSTDADLTISTNVESTLTGRQERMIVAFTEGDRAAHIWPITVELYTPAVPDVVEKAYDLGTINANFVYDGDPSRITPTTLHNDYTLPFPEIEEGQDAVYKFTVASDMVLNAYVDENAENGKVALYTEDFYGEGGPMAHNNYEGDIMSVNGGGQGGAAFEATIGSESATSSTTRAPFYPYFENSYSTILYLASELNEASVTTAPMSSLSWYANSVTGYATEGVKVWIGNYAESSLPSTTPNVNNMSYVFQGSVTPVVGWNEFAFNQGSFAWDGHSNILVCVQHNHPGVYHSGQTWRAENVGYNAVGYDYDDDIVFDLANNTYSFYGTETYRPITKMKATGSRDDSRAIVSIGERTGTSYYYPVNMYYRFSVTQQLYTAEEIGTAGIINSISFDYTYSGTIDEKPNVQLYMMNTDKQSFENNSDWVNYADATLVWNGPIEANGAGWVTLTLDTPFYYDGTSNLLVAFNDMSNDWDGTSFTFGTYNTPNYGCLYAQRDGSTPYDLNSLPSGSRVMNRNNIQLDITPSAPVGGFLAGPVIEDLPIVAGTYYLVASATQDSYMVHIGTQSMPCPEVAYGPMPEDDEDDVDPAHVTLHWNLPNFATEWRLVFGTTYYPEEGHDQTIITDWSRELAYSYTIPFALWNNTNYFWHIDVRNSDGSITSCPYVSGPIWGFSTHMNVPQDLTVEDDAVFEDEEVVLNWNSVVDRTYRWYHVYRTDLRDGSTVLLDHTTVNDPSATHFVDNTIEYNMVGYEYYVTAVYDEGESDPSNRVTVKVSGYSNTTGINGYVYEQDSITPIGGVTVTVDGTDEFGDPHTYTAVTGQNGYYHMQVYVGTYTTAIATMEGYQDAEPYQNGPEFFIAHEASHDNMNFIMDELFIAPAHVCAEKVYVPSAEGDTLVKVWWDFNFFTTLTEDFEDWANTPYAWQNDAQYPWTLTTEAHEGTYALKSGNAGMGGTTSTLEVTVDIPQDGMFSFDLWSRGESTTDTYDWDVSRFYIDGQQKFQYGQHAGWETYSTAITAGTHTFRWVYKKDATVNPAQGDCFMIDNIKFVYNPDDRAVSFEPDRALNHYRIYRTNCYYYGPYYEGDPGGTIVLASAWVPDTAYFDVSWPITEPGVYKWGVGVVYEGNNPNNPNNGRESEITWSQNGSRDVIFSDDFENGLGNWTAVDVDGDGYNWELVDPETSLDIYANSGVSCAGSYSWMGLTGGLNPNNYMISPLVEGATNISYFVNVNSLYRDTYAVMASTTGNNVADFSIVFTETPSDSKSGAVHEANGNNRGGRDIWVDRSVDLPAGTKYVAFRHYNSYDMNFLLIDDVIITAGGAPTPGPTPGPTPEGDPTNYLALDRESETVWSDMCSPCIDKDMYIPNVSVNVVLNSHDSPEGTVVSFTNTNIYEEAFYPMGSVTLPESGYYAFDSFRRGEYIVNVTHEGYYPIVDTVDLWNGGDLRYVMTEILYPVKNLYVSRTGWAMWEPMTDADGIYPEDLEGYRHLEYYKVMCTSIDNEPIFNHNTPASQPFCQLTTVDPHSGLPFLLEGERYKVKVCAIYSTGQSAWCPPVIFQYEPCDHWGPVDEVTYNPSTAGNHIEWVFEHGHNQWIDSIPVGPVDPTGVTSFNVDFENGMPEGWTTIDANNDGYDWMLASAYTYSTLTGLGNNNSFDYMISESYVNGGVGAITPDNYLVSPQVSIVNGSTLTFWVTDGNDDYGAEHYGVAISTASNTNAADFTTIAEWTLLAKGSTKAVIRDRQLGDVWYEKTVDLSAYAGQNVYIAIRHFNCNDQWVICLDDITLTAGGAKGGNNIAAYKSEPVYRQYSDDALTLNFLALDNVDFRAYLLYNLIKDTRFVVVAEGNYGQFIVSANEERSDFGAMFEEFYSNVEANFATLTKTDISDQMTTWKTGIGSQFFLSITMDMYTSSIRTENDRCINSLPFCTSDLYEFESAYSGQTADDLEGTTLQDGCIGSSYNPSWYHMRVREDGQFIIHLEGHDPNNAATTRDVDFCIWGPFTDPTEPCVDQLTTDKIIDCSFSASYTEDIYLGYPDSEHDHGYADHGTINYHVPQAGEYYILMLTNYSNNPCVVNFTKTEGEGETDCDIVTPTNIIGFLITQDGEYLDIVGPDVRDYTDVDEFGDHVYCVRPIYPGPAILPDTNYYFSMGCPVCVSTNGGEILCDAGDPINSEVIDEQVHLWWGEAPVPPVPGENSFTESFDNDLNGWHVLDVNAGQGTWLHSTNQPYGHDYTGLAHSGAGFALCYSFVDYTGSFDTDSYLYTPQMYDIEAGSTLTFWADNANDDYPESFSVCVATAENPTAADFVQVWSGSAKEAAGQKAAYRHNANRYENWRAHSVDLSAFAGQRVWIAFHDVNYDMYEVWIDDVELSVGAKANRAEIEYYNVYRSEDNVDYTLIGTVPANEDNFYEYFDAPGSGTYYYQVTAVYSDGCESDPAVSAENPSQNYVVVGVTGIDENNDNVALFPNPTKGNVTIQAKGMHRVTVVSVLGQVVYDNELSADECTVNMSQFSAGMYMVRVYTENGMAVKRVTVMQ